MLLLLIFSTINICVVELKTSQSKYEGLITSLQLRLIVNTVFSVLPECWLTRHIALHTWYDLKKPQRLANQFCFNEQSWSLIITLWSLMRILSEPVLLVDIWYFLFWTLSKKCRVWIRGGKWRYQWWNHYTCISCSMHTRDSNFKDLKQTCVYIGRGRACNLMTD